MTSSPQDPAAAAPPCDLSLHEAAELYAVSARTLAQHIRLGQLPACKSPGATGRQWRVTADALDAAGYARRPAPVTPDVSVDPLVAQLRRELHAAQRAVAAERRRADDLDRRLGHALLQCGHLRTALAAATGGDAQPHEVDLDGASANWLVNAIRGEAADRRRGPGVHR